jgi:hypothetical protein
MTVNHEMDWHWPTRRANAVEKAPKKRRLRRHARWTLELAFMLVLVRLLPRRKE